MEKKFKLPKPFAIQWLEALRSGKYLQGGGTLSQPIYVNTPPTNIELNNFKFCCLGVAGHICGNRATLLSRGFLYTDGGSTLVNIPNELTMSTNDDLDNYPLVQVLSNLNDGITSSRYIGGYNLRPNVSTKIDVIFSEQSEYKFSFAEIADFIEDNTEFYETPNQ
jgi:hypothetical protein